MDPPDRDAPRPAGAVQSLERGLSVIRAFDAERPQMTLSEVAGRTGLTRATARRFLHTLVSLGYMSFDGRLFSLRPRVLELGHAYLSSMSLPELATPHLQALVDKVQESSSASILDDADIVYVARVPTSRIMTVTISVGTRFPAYATSMGRVLLAGLDDADLSRLLGRIELRPLTSNTVTSPNELRARLEQVRGQGWAMVDQELERGLRSIAAPLHNADGRTIAAINVSASSRRGSVAEIRDDLLPPLLETAAQIDHDLRVTPNAKLI